MIKWGKWYYFYFKKERENEQHAFTKVPNVTAHCFFDKCYISCIVN